MVRAIELFPPSLALSIHFCHALCQLAMRSLAQAMLPRPQMPSSSSVSSSDPAFSLSVEAQKQGEVCAGWAPMSIHPSPCPAATSRGCMVVSHSGQGIVSIMSDAKKPVMTRRCPRVPFCPILAM